MGLETAYVSNMLYNDGCALHVMVEVDALSSSIYVHWY
jgi:hypothetical protein